MSSFWATAYAFDLGTTHPALINGQAGYNYMGPGTGAYFATDAADIGIDYGSMSFNITPGNTVTNSGIVTDGGSSPGYYTYSAGDKVKKITEMWAGFLWPFGDE